METIEELKEQLEKLQEQLKQQEKLASLGLLSAGIVHEIRNPLNFVINFSKLSDALLNDLSDGYLFLGVAQCVKGMKDEGLKNLEKAKTMGEPQAQAFIEKYSK